MVSTNLQVRLHSPSHVGHVHFNIAQRIASDAVATLVETKKNFTRRSVDQLGFIKDINSLVALSGLF